MHTSQHHAWIMKGHDEDISRSNQRFKREGRGRSVVLREGARQPEKYSQNIFNGTPFLQHWSWHSIAFASLKKHHKQPHSRNSSTTSPSRDLPYLTSNTPKRHNFDPVPIPLFPVSMSPSPPSPPDDAWVSCKSKKLSSPVKRLRNAKQRQIRKPIVIRPIVLA